MKSILPLYLLSLLLSVADCERNVLLIMVDDLRSEIEGMKMPNLEKFASESVRFSRAYPTLALCGPSRASIMTGRSPTALGYFSHGVPDRVEYNDILQGSLTMPEWFKFNGYQVLGTSKIFHQPFTTRQVFDTFYNLPTAEGDGCNDNMFCSVDQEEELVDYQAVEWATIKLADLAQQSQPWFMTVGIRRPHLPYRVPQRFLDLYDEESLPLPNDQVLRLPEAAPGAAFSLCPNMFEFVETRGFDADVPLPHDVIRLIRKGYFAASTWADELVGRLLDQVKQLGLFDSTVIVILSDHGFSLGEHKSYCKRANYDVAAQSVLYIRDPASLDSEGKPLQTPEGKENAPFSMLDVFPTVAELAGASLTPSEYSIYSVEGVSQAHRIRGVSRASQSTREVLEEFPPLGGMSGTFPFDTISFSVQPACFDGTGSGWQAKTVCEYFSTFDLMSFTVRTKFHRYTQYRVWNGQSDGKPIWAEALVYEELYDTHADPLEMENIVGESRVAATHSELRTMIDAQFYPCKRFSESECGDVSYCKYAPNLNLCINVNDCSSFHSDMTACSAAAYCTPKATGGSFSCVSTLSLEDRVAVSFITDSAAPTPSPTSRPTLFPTHYPTKSPTSFPTSRPTLFPTAFPTSQPTEFPSRFPTKSPTKQPTGLPTSFPTGYPTGLPTKYPSFKPTRSPTGRPTRSPTTTRPSSHPSMISTKSPTFLEVGEAPSSDQGTGETNDGVNEGNRDVSSTLKQQHPIVFVILGIVLWLSCLF